MRNNRTKFLLILGSIFAVILVVAIIILHGPPVPSLPTLPTPNGYTDFLEAGKMIRMESSDYAKMDQQQLRALVDSNTNALELVRSGLSEQIQVPMEFSQVYISNHLGDLSALKNIAFAFCAESQLAEMEQRPRDAANSCLDIIRLGIECRRGGALIDALMGIAIESMGTAQFQKIVSNLDAASCRELAAKLETIDA
jgi:hypothetical protein